MYKISILIVEDEAIIAADIELILQSNGYQIAGKAYNAVQAIDMLKSRHPDLVLLDIALKSEIDGVDLGEIIKSKYQIPFIFLTSFSDQSTLQRAKSVLPLGFVVKPFKEEDLISTIEIGMYRFQQEKESIYLNKDKLELRFDIVLTKMEYVTLCKLWEGKSNKAISEELYLSVNTIKTHIKNLFEKFGVNSRSELIAALRR